MENLFSLAHACLTESNLDRKIQLSEVNSRLMTSGVTEVVPLGFNKEIIKPGRPEIPVLVAPRDLPKRKLHTDEGRAAMIHSFAHIEFNAINLAWDVICRFQDMPDEFYMDWAQVAQEETKHFQMLRELLNDLSFDYGDFAAHDGLWKIAEETSHDLLLRLAVVPRIMEARGLDVTPGLIERFRNLNDEKTCEVLALILKEEIGHVHIGTKWYRYQCKQINRDADEMFNEIASEFLPHTDSRKINISARRKAGFSSSELNYLMSNQH